MRSYIEEQVNRTGRWIRKYMRGRLEEVPEKVRLGDEIMNLLIKRETSLADALSALTTLMLNACGAYARQAAYGGANADDFYLLQSRFVEEFTRFRASTEGDRAVGFIPKQPGDLAAKVQPRTVTMDEEQPERIRRLVIEVGELISKRRPSFGDGQDALTGTMLTAIEATCGRERADEFDLLIAWFSKEVIRFTGGRVQ